MIGANCPDFFSIFFAKSIDKTMKMWYNIIVQKKRLRDNLKREKVIIMTKEEMIEEIQRQEAKLNLDLCEYESKNAPDDGDDMNGLLWSGLDVTYQNKLHAWYSVRQLMKALDISKNMELEDNLKAREYSHDLYMRRKASREKKKIV